MNAKDNYFSVCAWLMLSLIIVGSYACSSSTDSYRPFVNKKIPVYPQKLDTVFIQTSKDKIHFKIPKLDDPIVTKIGIFWNNETDSLKLSYPDDKDTLSVVIDTLKGGQKYSFNFYNFDGDGYKSLKTNRLVMIPSHNPRPVKLNKTLWSNAKLPTDTWTHYSHYSFEQLWDNDATQEGHSFETTDWNSLPMWFTINLGQKARITEGIFFPQPHWSGEWPKKFQIWGSAKPKVEPEDPFNNSWVLLGTFEPIKPGDPVYENPDTPFPENAVSLSIKNSSNFGYVQYIRIKVLSKTGTDAYLDFGEFTFFGFPKNRKLNNNGR